MTLPVPNLQAAIAEVKDRAGKLVGRAFLIAPWNSFFQQLTQPAPAVANLTLVGSPFVYTANAKGTIIITGGTISNISLVRGVTTINLTGQRLVPISIGDTVSITYTVTPVVQFLGA